MFLPYSLGLSLWNTTIEILTRPFRYLSKDAYKGLSCHICPYKVTQVYKVWRITLSHMRLFGLGVWFSLWVREVPGSNPGRAHYFFCIHRFIGMPLFCCCFLFPKGFPFSQFHNIHNFSVIIESLFVGSISCHFKQKFLRPPNK